MAVIDQLAPRGQDGCRPAESPQSQQSALDGIVHAPQPADAKSVITAAGSPFLADLLGRDTSAMGASSFLPSDFKLT